MGKYSELITDLEERLKAVRMVIEYVRKLEGMPLPDVQQAAAVDGNGHQSTPNDAKVRQATPTGSKKCSKCGKEKPVAEFIKGGKGAQCKTCVREYQKEWARKRAVKAGKGSRSGPLPFKCPECSNRFSSKDALENHQQLDHEQ